MEHHNNPREQEKHIRDLISRVIDGAPSDDELDTFITLLRDSEEVRSAWRQAIAIHAELGLLINPPRSFSPEELLLIDEKRALADLQLTDDNGAGPGVAPRSLKVPASRRRLSVALTCAAAVAIALALFPQSQPELASSTADSQNTAVEDAPKPVAAVVRSVGSDFSAGLYSTGHLSVGQVIEFSRGLIELEINQGVTLVAYAPSRLRIEAEDIVWLDFGRVSVQVDEGYEGFQVTTDQAVVTDLGTSFSVDAEANGSSTVRVHSGEVDVRSRADAGTTQRVLEGHLVRVAESVSEPQPEESPPSGERPLVSLSAPHRIVPCKQDAYIIGGGFRDLNKGDSELLLVKLDMKEPTYCRNAWVDFDLSGISRESLIAARVALTVVPNDIADVKHPSNVPSDCNWQFQVSGIWNDNLPAWNEATLTWNNAPGHDAGDFLGRRLGPSTPQSLGQFTIHGRGVRGEQAVVDNPMLLDFLRADRDGQITLMVTRETGYTWSTKSEDMVIHSFASKEHPTLPPPTLELWFD